METYWAFRENQKRILEKKGNKRSQVAILSHFTMSVSMDKRVETTYSKLFNTPIKGFVWAAILQEIETKYFSNYAIQ